MVTMTALESATSMKMLDDLVRRYPRAMRSVASLCVVSQPPGVDGIVVTIAYKNGSSREFTAKDLRGISNQIQEIEISLRPRPRNAWHFHGGSYAR